MRRWAIVFAMVLALTPESESGAQGTAVVPSLDHVYADIDRLSELRVLDSVIIGQRPYSRREIARIARVAQARLDGHRSAARFTEETIALAAALIRRIELRFRDAAEGGGAEPRVSILDGALLSVNATDADRRGFPSSQTRSTEATIDPLARRRLGTPPVHGTSASVELAQRIEATPWLAVQARERFEYLRPDSGIAGSDASILLASVRARYRNVGLTVGRSEYGWAQSEDHGLLLASDAPALDHVSLASDHPFRLPGFFRRLGPTAATLIVADLGPSVVRSNSKFLAYKVSISPTSSLELGGMFANHFGGAGARSSSTKDRIIDFLPFIDILRRHNYADTTRALDVDSDKVLGIDGRVRLDALGGITLTGELEIEDFDIRRLTDLLTGYGAQTANIIIPTLGSPAWSARLSAKHTGIITYTHSQRTGGMTTRGRLLGDELGPDAKSFGAQLRWTPNAVTRFELKGRSQIHSNATYLSYYADADQSVFVVQKTGSSPNELRDIVIASMVLQTDASVAFTARGGAQRIRNAGFAGGRRRDYVAEFSVWVGQ